MCIYMGVRKFGQYIYPNQKIEPFTYFLLQKGVYDKPGLQYVTVVFSDHTHLLFYIFALTVFRIHQSLNS